jgi:hypothetical protein
LAKIGQLDLLPQLARPVSVNSGIHIRQELVDAALKEAGE